jgi:hypothetical protein
MVDDHSDRNVPAAPVHTSTVDAEPAGAQQQPDQPHLSCQQEGASQYECGSPGNVQVNDPPTADHYFSVLG